MHFPTTSELPPNSTNHNAHCHDEHDDTDNAVQSLFAHK